jgi:predicted AAA+ superfamily ATPase
MEKEKTIEILNEWNYWNKPLPDTYKREKYEIEIDKKYKTEEIIFLKGVRRSGKSTILINHIKNLISKGVKKEEILFVNLEDPRFAPFLNLELLEEIKSTYLFYLNPKNKPHIFLDEIQNIDGFEKWLLKEYELKNSYLYATGSNSKLLSKEIGSTLSGRYLDILVYPLSFKEFLSFKGKHILNEFEYISNKLEIERFFEEYTNYGGFPKVILTDDYEIKQAELKSYFDSILLRDIVARYKLDNFLKLEQLAVILLSNISNLESNNKLKNLLNVSYDTIDKYLEYLQNAFLIYSVRKFDWSLKKQMANPKKIYSIDTGLSKRISFEVGRKKGDLLENIVFLELKRKYESIFYYKTKENYEVDFLIKEQEKITHLIQVSLTLNNEKTKQREIRSLIKAKKELNCDAKLIIITLDNNQILDIDNEQIEIINIITWR